MECNHGRHGHHFNHVRLIIDDENWDHHWNTVHVVADEILPAIVFEREKGV